MSVVLGRAAALTRERIVEVEANEQRKTSYDSELMLFPGNGEVQV